MTQKQTDYDNALHETVAQINDYRPKWDIEQAIEFAFSQGYKHGKQTRKKAKENEDAFALDDFSQSLPKHTRLKIIEKYHEYYPQAFNGYAVGFCAALRLVFGYDCFEPHEI